MMTESIKKRMYRDIAMLIFLILTGIAILLASKANAASLSNDNVQEIKVEQVDNTATNP